MNIITAWLESRRRGRAIADLRSLPPEVLRDIGIEQGQISEAVSGLISRSGPAPSAHPAPARERRFKPVLVHSPACPSRA